MTYVVRRSEEHQQGKQSGHLPSSVSLSRRCLNKWKGLKKFMNPSRSETAPVRRDYNIKWLLMIINLFLSASNLRDIEVKLLKGLSGHQHMVQFHDAFEDDQNIYIVMELCEGENSLTEFYPDGSLSTVETLASTAICGILHSILGGQPLLILGVAEPTIIMYSYLYNFAKGRQDFGQQLFLAWAGWVCTWTAHSPTLLSFGDF
ncbi:unnamed protein product [Lactuca virosa]|uniref:Protein kinase domain-containing protein n=1 Tax=Lactuca virosa TaxID=75947 RepID=A0AAU9LM11_9ASTR|nr:unnamed protein product [Lactuca virosa]